MECFCFVVKENGKVRELGFGNWELGRYCQVFVLNNGLWKVLVLDGKIMWKWNEGN